MKAQPTRISALEQVEECHTALCEAAALNELLCRVIAIDQETLPILGNQTPEDEHLRLGLVALCKNTQRRLFSTMEQNAM